MDNLGMDVCELAKVYFSYIKVFDNAKWNFHLNHINWYQQYEFQSIIAI